MGRERLYSDFGWKHYVEQGLPDLDRSVTVNKVAADRGEKMKHLLSCIMFVLITSLILVAQNGTGNQTEEPFSIVITTPDATVRPDGDVAIKIRLTNTSDHPINASYQVIWGINEGYKYEVRDTNGNVLPRKEQKGGAEGSLRFRTLNPGESLQNNVVLSRVYDMSSPGEYVIQVSRNISGNETDGVVKSNKLKITVTP